MPATVATPNTFLGIIGRTYIENKSVLELARPVLNEKLKQQVFDPRWFGLSTLVQYM